MLPARPIINGARLQYVTATGTTVANQVVLNAGSANKALLYGWIYSGAAGADCHVLIADGVPTLRWLWRHVSITGQKTVETVWLPAPIYLDIAVGGQELYMARNAAFSTSISAIFESLDDQD